MEKNSDITLTGDNGSFNVDESVFVHNHKKHRISKNLIVPEDKITGRILNAFKIRAFKDELSSLIKK